jgi:regulator of protease activity HflC (stomatin/prohibitin superfamily)
MVAALVIIIVLIVLGGAVTAARSIKIVQQFEQGIVFRFGRIEAKPRGAGITFIRPVGDRMQKVNMQIVAMTVPAQDGITKDNVTVRVDAVVYFRVVDPIKATINVQNYLFAISQQAQTSLRSIIGQSEMDQLLSERDTVNRELRRIIDEPTEGPWGVRVERVEIKDVSLPESMKRSMSRQAEAERERRARIITADGEYQASKRLAAAANVMARDPAALQLRLLQTVVEVAAEKNSTLVMPVPVELLRFFDKLTPPAAAGGGKSAADSASLADFGNEDVASEEAAIEHTSGAPALESEKIPPAPEVEAAPVPEVPEVEAARVPEVDASSIPQVEAAGVPAAEAGAAGVSGSEAGTAAGDGAAADTDPVPRQSAPAPRGGRRAARPGSGR